MRETLTAVPPFDGFLEPGPHGVHSGNGEFLDDGYTRAGFALQAINCDVVFRRDGLIHALTRLPCLAALPDIETADRLEADPSLSALQLIISKEVRLAIAGSNASVDWPLRNVLIPLVIRYSAALADPGFNGHTQQSAPIRRSLFGIVRGKQRALRRAPFRPPMARCSTARATRAPFTVQHRRSAAWAAVRRIRGTRPHAERSEGRAAHGRARRRIGQP